MSSMGPISRQLPVAPNPSSMSRGNKIFIAAAALIALGGISLVVANFALHHFNTLYRWIGVGAAGGGTLLTLGGIGYHFFHAKKEDVFIRYKNHLLEINKSRAITPLTPLEKEEALKRHVKLVAEKTAVEEGEIEKAIHQIASKSYPRGYYLENIGNEKWLVSQIDESSFPIVDLIVKKELGHGTCASVWRLVSLNNGSESALKMAHSYSHLPEDPTGGVAEMVREAQEGLENEVHILHFLHKKTLAHGIQIPPFNLHPIVIVTPEGKKELGFQGTLYKGDLAKKPPDKPSELRKCLSDLTKGLVHSQREGVRHGDIKPQNMFRSGDNFYIADWGSAILYSDLKLKFQSAFQSWSSKFNIKKLSEKAIEEAIEQVRDLRGASTFDFMSPDDENALLDAFIHNDWKKFQEAEQARDIYALGASIVSLIVGIDETRQVLADIKNPFSPKAPGLKCLPPNLVDQCKGKGLSKKQIEMLDRMLRDSERPSAAQIAHDFRYYGENRPHLSILKNLKNNFLEKPKFVFLKDIK